MSAPAPALKTEQAILGRFQELRNEVDSLASRASDLSAELQEHELVLKALEPLDGGRKCFRLVHAPLSLGAAKSAAALPARSVCSSVQWRLHVYSAE